MGFVSLEGMRGEADMGESVSGRVLSLRSNKENASEFLEGLILVSETGLCGY